MRYFLQNQYADSLWEDMGPSYRYSLPDAACEVARRLSYEYLFYGRVRVIDADTYQVVALYSRGDRK